MSHQVEVLDLLTDLNRTRGTTIVMVLHDLNLAARYADYLVAMADRRVYAAGDPAEVLTSDNVRTVFESTRGLVPRRSQEWQRSGRFSPANATFSIFVRRRRCERQMAPR